jgi:alpha-1,6-mannosyltransferase
MRRVYVPQFDYHLAISRYTATELECQTPKHPRSVAVLPLGVEAERFSPSRRNETVRRMIFDRIGGSATARVLVYAGRLATEKNLGLLPATLERLCEAGDDYRLLVVGDGPLAGWLAAESRRRAPNRVSFWPHLDREALATLLANADAFLHPNPREPFGIGPLEAMASGLPLVAPDTGGVTTYATEESAWPAPAHPEAFAGRIREVFADPLERSRKTARALCVAWDYRWEVTGKRFLATYEQLIRGSVQTSLTRS